MERATIQIKGMTCSHCQSFVKNLITDMKGVQLVSVNLEKGTADIEFDPETIRLDNILDEINHTHYQAAV